MKATILTKWKEIKSFEILTGRHGEYEEKFNPYMSSDFQIILENTDNDICFYLEAINFLAPRKTVFRIDEKETVLI